LQDIDGRPTKMDKYKGKVVLVVNLASTCGFTPQYAELQDLYQKYSSKGLVVLGFPVSCAAVSAGASSNGAADGSKLAFGVVRSLCSLLVWWDLAASAFMSLHRLPGLPASVSFGNDAIMYRSPARH
jgi:hypothetical protein